MRRILALCLLGAPHLFGTCSCLVSRSACTEVAESNLVFIGTVEAIQPALLNEWQPNVRRDWRTQPDILALKKEESPKALNTLKARYLQLLSDLPADEKFRLAAAKNQQELQNVMTWIISQGTKVRFQVKTLIQRKEDADDDDHAANKNSSSDAKKDDDSAPAPKSLEIWNEAGDCGIPFQLGETYVVYAVDDEESAHPYTSVCHRTARISDAGDDLAYLYFFEHDHTNSARLEGFITSDIAQLESQPFRYLNYIGSPVAGVIVELKSTKGTRYTEPDINGRFIFDGLVSGDYEVSVWESGFPKRTDRLAGPKKIHVESARCVSTKMLVLTRDREH